MTVGIGAWAQAIVNPEAGKYYRIRHASGLYLTDTGFESTIESKAESNSQIVEFVPVAGTTNVYNIRRVSTGMFMGAGSPYCSGYNASREWVTAPISRNIPLAQFAIEPSATDGTKVLLQNQGKKNASKGYLGTDNVATSSSVYTDKDGSDADKHLWSIEEAEKYESEEAELADVYPEHTLPESDPRANAYEGYKLVFAQEFSGTTDTIDHGIWNFEEGFLRNNEDQYYNGDKNCYVKDGVLVIEGKYVLDQKIKNPKYAPFNKNSWPAKIGPYLTWTSGSMQTKGDWQSGYTWQYGIYEVRAKVPQYVGSWPAIWSTGRQYEWPYGGEIDIMEYYGGKIHANVCWGDGARWAGHWNSATVSDSELGAGWGDEFHIWRMVWDYNHMELWCDDFLVNNINLDLTVNDIPDADYDHSNGKNPFRDVRHMLWLNLALGGNNGGSLTNTPRPLYYLIDYARVYQKIGTDGLATYAVDEEISEPTFSLKDGTTAVKYVGAETTKAAEGVYNLQGMRMANSVDQIGSGCGKQVYVVVENSKAKKTIR